MTKFGDSIQFFSAGKLPSLFTAITTMFTAFQSPNITQCTVELTKYWRRCGDFNVAVKMLSAATSSELHKRKTGLEIHCDRIQTLTSSEASFGSQCNHVLQAKSTVHIQSQKIECILIDQLQSVNALPWSDVGR